MSEFKETEKEEIRAWWSRGRLSPYREKPRVGDGMPCMTELFPGCLMSSRWKRAGDTRGGEGRIMVCTLSLGALVDLPDVQGMNQGQAAVRPRRPRNVGEEIAALGPELGGLGRAMTRVSPLPTPPGGSCRSSDPLFKLSRRRILHRAARSSPTLSGRRPRPKFPRALVDRPPWDDQPAQSVCFGRGPRRLCRTRRGSMAPPSRGVTIPRDGTAGIVRGLYPTSGTNERHARSEETNIE